MNKNDVNEMTDEAKTDNQNETVNNPEIIESKSEIIENKNLEREPLLETMALVNVPDHALTELEESTGPWAKRVVVITGASSGIGLAAARRFCLFADVVYNLSTTRQEDDSINFIKTDLTRSDEVRAAFEQIFKREGQIDILINNAGISHAGAAENTTDEDAARVFELNFHGMTRACAAVIPYMREQKRGMIINVSSLAAVYPLPFQSIYSASKAAVLNFTQSLRSEVRPFKIRVSTVMFGPTKTNLTEKRIKNDVNDRSYKYRIARSIGKFEYEEQNGGSADAIARKLFRLSNKKNPKPVVVFGFKNRLSVFFSRFLTVKYTNKLISRKY